MTIKEARLKAGKSQTAAAAIVPCSPNTWRLYEANPAAVRPEIRALCDVALAKLRSLSEHEAA
ncbi:MAG: hypothetical protein ABI548_25350 [Polyangiaceae bacterium]